MPDESEKPLSHAADKAAESVKKAAETVKSKSVSAPRSALSTVRQIDRFILRLNKLTSTPGGLSALLSTSNYILYILAYLQPRIPLIRARLLALLKLPAHLAAPSAVTTPPLASLALLLSQCRTTLRLLGTLPLYAWLRSLLAGPKPGADPVLHRIALAQASSYFTYQLLENICVLADHGVLPASVIARLNRGVPSTARLYTVAYRFWLAGVSCDYLRLGREWQTVSAKRRARAEAEAVEAREDDARVDRRWWMDLAIASAWFPMALHFSGVTGGVPGWNMGVMGLCGLIAGGERIRGLWRATG